ncbi:MAG: PrsW family intramembrane metalloprotease [Erysipelotrichaceae bacterium]|nr:PrsW family intramembrane metalloprotease [Erysipelotrichaceae bacterium]
MNFIENIYICLAAPLLIAVICLNRLGRPMVLFVFAGMTVCLLSSYISTFLAAAYHIDLITASITISPIVEETMKLLPVLYYLLVFEPDVNRIPACVILIAMGFATFENVCYLVQNDTMQFTNLLIRGFGTGAMHVVCGTFLFIGFSLFWDKVWLRAAGTVGLLAVAVTFHGIYNMLVLQDGIIATIGYLIPLISAIIVFIMNSRSKI